MAINDGEYLSEQAQQAGPAPASARIYLEISPYNSDANTGNERYYELDDILQSENNLSELASAATARTNLGLAIGSDVQAWDTQLDDIAALAVTDGNFIVGNGVNWVAESGATARTSLGLGTIALIDDAPNDGDFYGRQNAAWVAADTIPIPDNLPIIEGSADSTKLLRIEVDGLTTGLTRVWTAPDINMTVAGLEAPQTFSATNTFTGTVNINTVNGIDYSVGVTGVDVDLITVDSKRIYWDDSESAFTFDASQKIDSGSGVPLFVVGTLGELRLTTSETDATTKNARLTMTHYTAEEPVMMILGASSSGAATISFGGGSGTTNAANEVRFYTGVGVVTSGTLRMTIRNSGNVGIGVQLGSAQLHVVQSGSSEPAFKTDQQTLSQPHWRITSGADQDMILFDIDTTNGGEASWDESASNLVWDKNLEIAGAFGVGLTTITGVSHTAADNTVILVDDDTAGSTVTITLPAAAGVANRTYFIKKLGTTANVIIDGNASETIDGATTQTLSSQYDSIQIICDGTGWWII